MNKHVNLFRHTIYITIVCIMLGCTNISAGQSQLESIERRLRSVRKIVSPAIVRIMCGEDKEHEWHFGSGVIVTVGIPWDGAPEHTSVELIRKHWDDLASSNISRNTAGRGAHKGAKND